MISFCSHLIICIYLFIEISYLGEQIVICTKRLLRSPRPPHLPVPDGSVRTHLAGEACDFTVTIQPGGFGLLMAAWQTSSIMSCSSGQELPGGLRHAEA